MLAHTSHNKFLSKDRVQWGFTSKNESDNWAVIDDKVAAPPGIEKKVGFQGNADPTGYYAQIGSRGYDGLDKRDVKRALN